MSGRSLNAREVDEGAVGLVFEVGDGVSALRLRCAWTWRAEGAAEPSSPASSAQEQVHVEISTGETQMHVQLLAVV